MHKFWLHGALSRTLRAGHRPGIAPGAYDRVNDESADYDRVTGLATQATLLRRLSQRADAQAAYTLCALRLANFEGVLSTVGPAAGDGVLLAFVARLERALDRVQCARNTLARIDGGQCFAFVLEATVEPCLRDLAQQLSGEVHAGALRYRPEWVLATADAATAGNTPALLLASVLAALGVATPSAVTRAAAGASQFERRCSVGLAVAP